MHKKSRRGQLRKMLGTQLIRFSRRMQWVRKQQQRIHQTWLFCQKHARLSSPVRMPTQKYLPVFPFAHHRNGTTKPVSIAAGTTGKRRSMRTLPPKRQIASQNREPRRGKRIRHLYQKFRLAIRPSPMRKNNGLSSIPSRLVQPPKNARLATNIFKRYSHMSRDHSESPVYSSPKSPSNSRVSRGFSPHK